MANLNMIPPVIVVHKGPRKNSKIILQRFENTRVDDIISARKRNPIIPNESEILEIGVGDSFIERYRKKYKL